MTIALAKDRREGAVASLQRYFAEVRGEELGNLDAGELLDFFLKEIAPGVYNHAIADAQSAMANWASELDSVCYEAEGTYWQARRRGRSSPP